MRILNVTESYAPFYEFGGPPAKVEALSRGLAERGHDVTVLTADWGVERRIAGTDGKKKFSRSPFGWAGKDRGVKSIHLPTWLRYRATSWNPGIGKFLRAQIGEFDVAHIFGLYDLLGPAAGSACVKQGVPYVVEPIGMFVPIVRNVKLKRIYHATFGKRMLTNAARVIATSQQEIEELAGGGIPREKILLRRNGVMMPETLSERGVFRRKWGISAADLVVLFLGRLSEKKSPELLLRAFSQIPETAGTSVVRLIFAGPDESGMEARLKNIARELQVDSRVIFSGAVFEEGKWAAYLDAIVFKLVWRTANVLLVVCLAGTVYSAGWEYSVRQYLNGFSDAIVPVPATPQQKVEAILNWMRSGPPRAVAADPDALPQRDPETTFDDKQLP